jgi:hypothetical protein
MEQEIHYKETSVLAKTAFISWLLAMGSIILFSLFVAIGMDFGVFVLLTVILFISSFVLGWISLVVIVIWHKSTKGLILAILSILLSSAPIYVFFCIWLGVQAREQRGKEYTGLYNLELLGGELTKYAKDHNGYLPDANTWCDSLLRNNKNLTKDNFRHPLHKNVSKAKFKLPPYPFPEAFQFVGDCQFAFNSKLSGLRLADIPGDVILLFEADGPWNLNGGSDLFNTRYREKGYITLLSVDGTETEYWYYKNAVRKFRSEFGGRASMYYEQPRWEP